ncbi:unnamed protein product [Closterium sp. NIES-64]|nr:unnamed protein product [Closterium sp. NIES-64]
MLQMLEVHVEAEEWGRESAQAREAHSREAEAAGQEARMVVKGMRAMEYACMDVAAQVAAQVAVHIPARTHRVPYNYGRWLQMVLQQHTGKFRGVLNGIDSMVHLLSCGVERDCPLP